ncbi:YesL family protein [Fredinandcohnia quinoae]|uniref:DUF624 domain-containing protein n=1 Tax=Fredinandcohnia quinoae TaxID=2918902 RepID=A0AAW5E544_9BACI|nr:DUF624 domain-containing protein [Fredinandcohnia sp. SECRCQ15]MCH1624476.1 DUF624 domain-containing protein [Fredinandcohnia sp. SECRCQ15]
MEVSGWKRSLVYYADWALKLVYVNILWLFGSVLGLFVTGIFPSTIAMFAVIRKWLQGEDDFSTFMYFRQVYQKEFLGSNLYGYIWAILGFILYFDLQFFRQFTSLWSLLLTYFTFMIGVIYVLCLLFAFPVYVHFQLRPLQYIKNTILLVLSQPIVSVIMALAFYFPYYLMIKIPGLLPFFCGSLIAFCLMMIAMKLFNKLEKKAQ